METFAETRKENLKDGNSGTEQNYGSETIVYLQNRAEQESYLKQQVELRKQELALQQERQVQQQHQQNLSQQKMMEQQQLILAMFKKKSDKD